MLRLSLLIQATERVTGPVRRIRAGIRGMARDGERDVGRLGRMMDRLRSTGTRLSRSFTFTGMRSNLGSLIRRVRELSGRAGMRGLEMASRAASSAVRSVARAAGGLAIRGAAVAGAGVGFLGGWLTAGVIDIASKFEQFQVVLENTEGSAAGARKAMAWVKEFAKTTPYEVEQVMEAFVSLKAFGIDPMNGSLKALGNASSGMGKPLMQAIEMMADAQTGEFERLKEFGIRAKQAGEQVTFTYMRAGKEVTTTAKKNAVAIQRALIGIFDARFKGMMDRQSRTLSGMWSNIKDQVANFQLDVANAGFFDFVKGKVQALLDKVSELARNGTLEKWAENTSKWLEDNGEKLWKFATETDWDKLGTDLRNVGDAVMTVARAVGRLARNLDRLGNGVKWSPLGMILQAKDFLSQRGAEANERMSPRTGGAATRAYQRGGIPLRGFPAPQRQQLGPALRSGRAAAQSRASVESRAQVDVRLLLPPGVQARTTKMKGDRGTDVNVAARGWLNVA